MLVRLEKKQVIKQCVFKKMVWRKTSCMKILTTVFSLGSLICEFQTFYILLSEGGARII